VNVPIVNSTPSASASWTSAKGARGSWRGPIRTTSRGFDADR